MPGSEGNATAAASGISDGNRGNKTSAMESGGDVESYRTTITTSNTLDTDENEGKKETIGPSSEVDSEEAVVGLSFIDASLLPIARAFRGTVLLAPALSASAPAWMKVTLDLVAQPFFPTALVPTVLRRPTDDSATWSNKDYLKYNLTDHYPHGLSWGKNLRFGTATAMLQMMEVVKFEVPAFRGPFLCIMDPADQVVSIDGVKHLMREAGTEQSPFSEDVEVIDDEYDQAASASSAPAPAPAPANSSADKCNAEASPPSPHFGDDIPTENAYGSFVSLPGGGASTA